VIFSPIVIVCPVVILCPIVILGLDPRINART
jgi:hypothetical protein